MKFNAMRKKNENLTYFEISQFINQGLRFRYALSECLPNLRPFVHSGIFFVVIESRLEFLLRLLDLTVMFFRGPKVLLDLP
ncbi:hypothetical protein T02_5291 [Trichinella nativa]|uniref:Uncharacterized protein n=2 Tax=Trichinella TaxID=6333 RepID=A0A0V1KMG3_9BILA|nr:hypothetical protein T02_5291 [Trichinella nativa]